MMCHAIIKGEQGFRECQLKEWRDGLCKLHHPEMEQKREREKKEQEEANHQDRMVGQFLRLKHPELYEKISKDRKHWYMTRLAPNAVWSDEDRQLLRKLAGRW